MEDEDLPGYAQDVELDSPKLNSPAAEEFAARSFQRVNRTEFDAKRQRRYERIQAMQEQIQATPRPRTIRVLGDRFHQLVETLPELTTSLLAGSGGLSRRGFFQWVRSLF